MIKKQRHRLIIQRNIHKYTLRKIRRRKTKTTARELQRIAKLEQLIKKIDYQLELASRQELVK